MTLVPAKKIHDGLWRNSMGQLIGSKDMPYSQFLKRCEMDLRLTPGGMDGLIKTESGYTTRERSLTNA